MRLAEQVAEQIIGLIRERHLEPGDRLPTESELMERLEGKDLLPAA